MSGCASGDGNVDRSHGWQSDAPALVFRLNVYRRAGARPVAWNAHIEPLVSVMRPGTASLGAAA